MESLKAQKYHREFYPVNMNGCVLYLPFYRYGAEARKIWDLSGNGNHGIIYGATSYNLYGPETITNGNFSSGNPPTGWTQYGSPAKFESSTSQLPSGFANACHINDSSPGSGGGFYQGNPTVTGQQYVLRYWYYIVSGSIYGGHLAGDGSEWAIQTYLTTTGQWVYREDVFTQPVGGSTYGALFQNASKSVAAEFYIAGVSVIPITGSGALGNASPNPGLENCVEDGGFEYWSSATNPNYWQPSVSGGSTVNRDDVNQHGGKYCVRLDIDSSNSTAQVVLNGIESSGVGIDLIPGKQYVLNIWYKNSVTGKTARFLFCDYSTSGLSLQLNGTWVSGTSYQTLPNATNWTLLSIPFTAPAAYSNYALYLLNNSAASSSIWFDDISVIPVSSNPAIGWNFDGVHSYIQCPTISLPSVSCLMWVKAPSLVRDATIISKGTVYSDWTLLSTLDNGLLNLSGGSSTKVTASLVNSLNPSVNTYSLNKWHLFGFTITGTTGTIYIDGAQVASGSVAAVTNTSGAITIGAANIGTFFWGNIGEVLIFNRLLSAYEIKGYFDISRTKYGP